MGKQIAEVKILSNSEVKPVPFSELSDEKKLPTDADIAFKAIAAKIKSEVFKQSMIAPIKSNIIPLPHQILALEKVMSGFFCRTTMIVFFKIEAKFSFTILCG